MSNQAAAAEWIPAADAFRLAGIGRARGYDGIMRNELIAKRVGNRWFVLAESAEKLARSLARAAQREQAVYAQ